MSLKSESLPSIEQVKQRIAFHEAEQKRIEEKLQEDRELLLAVASQQSFVDLLRVSTGPTETAELFPQLKKEFAALLKKNHGVAYKDIKLRLNHVDVYGFFKANGNVYYIHFGGWGRSAYLRRAKDFNDFKGGRNWNLPLDSLEEFAQALRYGILNADPTPWP